MRKIRLSPMQRDILWMLEEAGRESLACASATLHYPAKDLDDAITGLKQLEFIVDDVEGSSPALSLSKAGKTAIRV